MGVTDKRLFQNRVVRTKIDIYVFINLSKFCPHFQQFVSYIVATRGIRGGKL